MAEATFYDYDLQTVRHDLIGVLTPAIEESRLFFEGDHWQGGSQWIGPALKARREDTEQELELLVRLAQGFTSENAVKEVVERHRDGVVGTEPNWYLAPIVQPEEGQELDEGTKALIVEASALLSAWWDRRGVLNTLQAAVDRRLYAGVGTLRVFIPRGKMSDTMRADQGRGLLRFVWVEAPAVGDAAVVVNLETMDEASAYLWNVEGQEFGEASFLTDPEDDLSPTMIRTFGQSGEVIETVQDLGGHILVHEMKGAPLVTPQVKQNQRLINLARTMMKENVIYGGFLERVITNASIPGTWKKEGDGRKRFIPDSWNVGPNVTSFLQSQVITDADGNQRALPTSISYKDPVPVATFKDTIELSKFAILSETKQLHSLATGDGAASGEARKQARYDFTRSLLGTKPEVDGLVRWMLGIALELEGTLTGEPGRYRALKVVSDIKINAGPLSADEKAEIRADRDAGLVSEQTAMALLGVDDTDAEAVQIAAEAKTKPKPLADLAAVGYTLSGPRQFPDIDESQGFAKRSAADLQAEEDEQANQDQLDREAKRRSLDPGNGVDDNDDDAKPKPDASA